MSTYTCNFVYMSKNKHIFDDKKTQRARFRFCARKKNPKHVFLHLIINVLDKGINQISK